MSEEIKIMKPYGGKGSIPYRLFWSWDHSTNWCMNVPGAQNCGVANSYNKQPEMFLKDYKRAVDWCADNGINAVGITGMIRERHGGEYSARQLCDYAREKGVCVYIIAGLYGYGGAYYEGRHEYNLDYFLERNPECIGRRADGRPVYATFYTHGGHKVEAQGCSSNPLLKEFVLESLDWLFQTVPELGGIQMEIGDSGSCQCENCVERRRAVGAAGFLSDMAGIYPQAADVVYKRSPDAMVICETYHHFLDSSCDVLRTAKLPQELKSLLDMPEKTFWQWKCDRLPSPITWNVEDKLPESMKKFHHVMRSHAGTQWWGGRHTLAVEQIRRQCMLSYHSGFDGVSMFGEQAPYHTNAEFNYLALQYFADAPNAGVANFAEDVMASRLGGVEPAYRYLELAGLYEEPEKIPAASLEIARIAGKMTDYNVIRRWQYLANFLNSYCWEDSQKDYGIPTKSGYGYPGY